MKIYVAGPYTAPTPEQVLANVNEAIRIGVELIEKGHTPFIPHLTHYVEMWQIENGAENRLGYEDYLAWDLSWLAECDAIYVIARSPGVDRELAYAKSVEMPVFYALNWVPDAKTTPEAPPSNPVIDFIQQNRVY